MQYAAVLDVSKWPLLSQVDWEHEVVARIAMSAALVVVLWAFRVLLARVVRRKTDILSADQRRWTRTVKNMVWMLIVLGLVLIWAPQLRTVALSLAAFVVAIVIATKEVILCFTGAFMRVSTAPFRMGDWITIDGITGEVVDINPFSAKLQELETEHGTYAFTGRIVQIPNSRYFSVPIVNISHLKHYRVYMFTVAMQEDRLNPAEMAGLLREIAARHTAPFKEEAAQVRGRIARNSSIPLPDAAPVVTFAGGDFNNQRFTVRLFVPTRTAVQVSSAIHEEFSALTAAMRKELNEKAKAWEVEKDVRIHAIINGGDKTV
jgi:small-conductance mechanosensitive channel